MKNNLLKLLVALVCLVVLGCSGAEAVDKKNYNDIRVTFVTTQGEITFYLYPEASPIAVSNFINLAKRNFYNETKIHRSIQNFMAQGGAHSEMGLEGPGYAIPDESSNWLDFFQGGMLAVANAGPNTGGSQFFMTVQPAEWLNGLHTVMGEAVSESDLVKISKLETGDVVKEVKFYGNVDLILSLNKENVDRWNVVLDKTFPGLPKYPVKPISAYGPEAKAYEEQVAALYAENRKEQNKEITLWPVPRFIAWVAKKFERKQELAETEKSTLETYGK